MNICDYIIENKIPHTIIGNKVHQISPLNLSCCGITCLKGFVQNSYLDLSHNKITSLKGFVQNGTLYLRRNKITSLEGFVQNGRVRIAYWPFELRDNGTLDIGCKNKTIEEWNEFFDNGEEFNLKNDSEDYLEIKKYFKMFYVEK